MLYPEFHLFLQDIHKAAQIKLHGRLRSETSKKDTTEEKWVERDNGVLLTQMRRFLGYKILCFNLQSGRYIRGLGVF